MDFLDFLGGFLGGGWEEKETWRFSDGEKLYYVADIILA